MDLDSSESETYGQQEGSAYNGYFCCRCYHPLFCFNQFGDLERAMLRNGNVHSAEGVVKFYNQRGVAEQWIKEGKNAVRWTKLSCHDFLDNQVRLQLFALAYNLGNFLWRLVLPRGLNWTMTTLREKLVKIGAKVVRSARYVTFQLAEVAVSKRLFTAILQRIERLRSPPLVPG